ncbi:ABSCISIC ACID-INSENSITIVE 5-like protein 7 [Heracleum sosnowskyi]|uniref:ABSCISIC ACID-INSENSITIVE 5-like protein 7 n=1 Tax=Heracleum sosnowskyi TaxID=360622 RepID=A0AAD8H374_9APIA|nr:ABSCISIC ACID-INSENSITIVE 5-like protein 7 [Heracleum sosnowskyi]
MGSYINFKNYGATSQPEGSGSKPAENLSLARQSSVYSLTFEELQNSLDGVGKDFGSMNMDELLKNIWTAEGTQPMISSGDIRQGIPLPSGNLKKQGSLTLPSTLSQKTVDEVWKDLLKETDHAKDGNGGINLSEREATLSEITLEEFLFRAGVVAETTHAIGRPNIGGSLGDISRQDNRNADLPFGFPQTEISYESRRNNVINSNAVRNPYPNSVLNSHGITPQQQSQQQQPLLPKQVTLAFASPMNAGNNAQLTSLGTRSPLVKRGDPFMNNSATQSCVRPNREISIATLAPRVGIPVGSPKGQLTSIINPDRNLDASSLSHFPYAYNEGTHGRKAGTFEKVVERRRKRMIKNRESAARSRARKQAYTLELEAEIAKLKEVNEEMQNKQEKFMEMQKNQMLEKMNLRWGSKRLCLRRTLTGPW